MKPIIRYGVKIDGASLVRDSEDVALFIAKSRANELRRRLINQHGLDGSTLKVVKLEIKEATDATER